MGNAELEELVVRLTGDGSKYKTMLDQAQSNTAAAARSVEKAASQIEGFGNKLQGFAATAVGALASLGTMNWLKEALGEWQTAESTALKLESQLISTGRAVESTMAQYRDFASALQRTTILGDDTTLAMLRQAETFELTGDAAMEAVRSAVALQAATTGSAEGAEGLIRLTAALAKGDIARAQQMARMVPQLRGVTDQSEFLAKAQQLIASGMATATAETRSSAGMLAQLKNSYGDLMEEFGKVVSEGIKPVVEWMGRAVEWFQGLSDKTKSVIVLFAALVAGTVALTAAIAAAGVVFNAMFGGAGIILGLLVSIGAAAIAWVATFDNIGAAWDYVKEKGIEFWNWVQPMWRALVGTATAAWELISTAALMFWDEIKSIWRNIVGDSEVDWAKIQKIIVTAFIAAEFAIKNFDRVLALAWTGAKLGFATLVNDIEHFFKATVPAYLNWFGENWQRVFRETFSNAGMMMGRMVSNMANIIGSLPRLLRGEVNLADLWTPLTEGLANVVRDLPTIPARGMGALEAQLRREFDSMSGALAGDWEAFRNRRLNEIMRADPEVLRSAEATGRSLGGALTNGVAKEMEKLDAVLRGSADALSRIAAYQERLRASSTGGGAARAAVSSVVSSVAAATAAGGPTPVPVPGAAAGTATAANQLAIIAAIRASAEAITTSIEENAPQFEGAGL